MTATAAATVAVAVQVAEAIRNVLLETANVLVHIPIIATVVIGKLTNIAPTAAIHQQVDVTVVPVVVVALVETIRNAITVTINATETHHTDARAALGLMMNTVQTDATIRQENATAVRVAVILRNATTVSIVAPIMFLKGAAAANG